MNTISTKDRAVKAACVAFANRGVSGTSLDGLAKELGVTKQAILYHFDSKDGLVQAVVQDGAAALFEVFSEAVADSAPGWDRVEAIVRAAFSLAINRPELLGLLREVNRLGDPWSSSAIKALSPLTEPAVAHVSDCMQKGLFKQGDPRLVLVSVYAAVTGVVVETEVLRAVGLQLDLRVAAQLRKTVLNFLQSALVD